jgi:hypothetical protein
LGDVVSLNKYRKSKQRAAAPQQAAVNRVKFGRSKTETRKSQAEADRRRKELDDKKLD